MATLRKWQPVQRRAQARAIAPDKILVICGAAAFGLTIFSLLQPDLTRQQDSQVVAAPAPNLRERTTAEAQRRDAQQRAETQERERQRAAIKAEQTRQQANLFNQRYNTDRMPVGSVNIEGVNTDMGPVTPAARQGFSVVKPSSPSGQSGHGFREVKWVRGQ